ncbi:MAG TPA: isoprenylcysteine carboxylmethyltransferase family protein [Thermoanaerobaculia bacterium]|jgi:protein-S-isoprenylcysteine O-methyltransferase Ste14|nr:isoprenylcysteine carboxylmethyltransferase family protein [Thermoanaerobaculia bacterium]
MTNPFVKKYAALLSTPVFLVLLLAIVALALTHSLLGHGPLTLGLQAAGVLLMIWARVTFGLRSFHYAANPTSGGLVTTGPYRFIRHPIYAAVLLIVWTGVAANWSLRAAALGLVATLMTVLRMLLEEALVIERYPEYAGYAQRTRRVIPFVL